MAFAPVSDPIQPKPPAASYDGSCFCGAVRLIVTGEPVAMGYCHCESCRSWSAAPINAFTLWKPDAVVVTVDLAPVAVLTISTFAPAIGAP